MIAFYCFWFCAGKMEICSEFSSSGKFERPLVKTSIVATHALCISNFACGAKSNLHSRKRFFEEVFQGLESYQVDVKFWMASQDEWLRSFDRGQNVSYQKKKNTWNTSLANAGINSWTLREKNIRLIDVRSVPRAIEH